MVRALSLLVALLVLAAAIVIVGLLTNWLRYGLSLEGLFVLASVLVVVGIVFVICYFSYTRYSYSGLVGAVFAAIAGTGFVLYVYDKSIGGLPQLYVSHIERSPPAVLETSKGPLKYWLEIQNPHSSQHAEFLVVERGKQVRIPIQIFTGAITGYLSPTKPSDWVTLTNTEEPDVMILVLGPSFASNNQRFKIDLASEKATKLPSS